MKHDAIKTAVLSIKMIPNADPMLREALRLEPDERSLGLITTDCDDVSYAALDEATKKAEVRVAYARSMYAGAGNASTRLAENLLVFLPEKIRQRFGADWRRRNFISKEMRIFTARMMKIPLFILPSVFQERAVICRKRRRSRGDTDGLSDRTASGSDGRSGCGFKGCSGRDESILRAAV